MNGIRFTQNKRNYLLLGTDIFLYNNYWTGKEKLELLQLNAP